MIKFNDLDSLIDWIEGIYKKIKEAVIYIDDDVRAEDSRYHYDELCSQIMELEDVIHFLNNLKEAQND
jgi:hypothetical protein